MAVIADLVMAWLERALSPVRKKNEPKRRMRHEKTPCGSGRFFLWLRNMLENFFAFKKLDQTADPVVVIKPIL